MANRGPDAGRRAFTSVFSRAFLASPSLTRAAGKIHCAAAALRHHATMIPPPWTDEEKQLARESCRKWAGTPHRNKIAVPGTGIDCINFVFEVVSDAGILPRFKLPNYHGNLGVLRKSNVMETLVGEYSFGARVPSGTPPEFGDIAIFKCGEQSNHAGILIDGKVWHVPGKSAVGPAEWATVAKSLQCLMRFSARGFRKSLESLTWEKILTSV